MSRFMQDRIKIKVNNSFWGSADLAYGENAIIGQLSRPF